jgi:hypothetical protein
VAERAEQPQRFSKEHRRAERARVTRLGRLPGPFMAFADRGRPQAAVVWLLQWTLLVAVGLTLCRLVTGDWLPRFAGVVVLALAIGLQSLNRSINLRAEKRPSP